MSLENTITSGCPNALHAWPLPNGYIQAHTEAEERLANGWANTKCPDCGLYGWTPSEGDQ